VAALPGVDLVVGNKEKSLLLEKIANHYSRLPRAVFPLSPHTPWGQGISRFDGHQRATLKVQDGCNFGCAFCLIPRVRGEMVSRPEAEILEEGRRLAGNGVKELVLAGIQLSSYARDWGKKAKEPRLAPVIVRLLAIPGIQRVRLSSYAVADFEEALLPLWKNHPGFCAHLHLPLQSGDAQILKAMRRPYSLEQYRETVLKVREAAPQVGLTGDIIVGFPGEIQEAFQNTLDRIREFDYVDFHPFPYSDRLGTPGERMNPKVSPAVIRERMKILGNLKMDCLKRSAEKAQGKTYRVIVEKHNSQHYAGLTDHGLRVVFFKDKTQLGQERWVRVEGFQDGRAWARILPDAE